MRTGWRARRVAQAVQLDPRQTRLCAQALELVAVGLWAQRCAGLVHRHQPVIRPADPEGQGLGFAPGAQCPQRLGQLRRWRRSRRLRRDFGAPSTVSVQTANRPVVRCRQRGTHKLTDAG
jgi:hypothetical protein